MNNKLNIAIAGLFLTTASMAVTEQDSKYYIGVGMTTDSGGSFGYDVNIDGKDYSSFYDSKTKSKKAKLGMFLESGDRLELSYQSGNNTLVDIEYDIKGIDISYKLFFEETKVGSFTPYGVVGIGKHELVIHTSTPNGKLKGNQWAAGAGGVYGIDKDLEVEISAKYTKVVYDKGLSIDYENSGKELYLGVNYKL